MSIEEKFGSAKPFSAENSDASGEILLAAAHRHRARATKPEHAATSKPEQTTTGKSAPEAHDSPKTPPAAAEPPVDPTTKIHNLLDNAKQVRANVDLPGAVWTDDELNFKASPAWIPRVWQKGQVDTVDDLILDRKGNLTVNEDKKPPKKSDGVVRIGVEADQVHWSPTYLPPEQQRTIRDTIDYLHQHNPKAPLPSQWTDVPSGCLAPPPEQQQTLLSIQSLQAQLNSKLDAKAPPAVEGQQPVDPNFAKLLDLNKLTDRIALAVASNEGTLTTVTLDDNHAGWSVGVRQWNQHVGELPDLIGAMYKKDPCTFAKDFGPFANKLINNVGDPSQASVNEPFVRHTDFSRMLGFADRKRQIINHLPDVQKALSDFQDVQVALTRKFVQDGVAMAKKYNFQSELGWAEVSDIINQKGANGAEQVLMKIPKDGKEIDRIKALEKGAHRPGGQTRLANLQTQFSPDKPGDDTQ